MCNKNVLPTSFPGPILVIGAGTTARYLAIKLAAAGADTTLIGAAPNCSKHEPSRFVIEEPDGFRVQVASSVMKWALEVPYGLPSTLVFLCVEKEEAEIHARHMMARLKPGTLVISIQSDISATRKVAFAAPSLSVLSALSPFCVSAQADGTLRRSNGRQILCQHSTHIEPWLESFQMAGFPLTLHNDIQNVLWGNLLLQLHEAIGVFSHLSGHQKFSQGVYRTCLADIIDEAHEVMSSAGIEPAASPFSPMLISLVLRLPDPLFRIFSKIIEDSFETASCGATQTALLLQICNHVRGLAQRERVSAPKTNILIRLIEARLQFREQITLSQVRKAFQGARAA